MKSPKTVTLPQKKVIDAEASEQPHPPSSDCCEKIRERAFYKWEAAGCPCGEGVEFWLQAEAELAAESKLKGDTNSA